MPLNGSRGVAAAKGYGFTASGAAAPLYEFTTATFGNGGRRGPSAPSNSELIASVSSPTASLWVNNTNFFQPSSGFSFWRPPQTGIYRIRVVGAQGGFSGEN